MTITRRFIAAAALSLLPTAAFAAALPSTVYQSAANFPAGCSAASCGMTFQPVPAGSTLKVDHFSCEISASPTRAVLTVRVSWGAGTVQQSVYQRPELVGRDSASSYWYVRGETGFIIPPGMTPKVDIYASATGPFFPACVLAGTLLASTP
ncbi:hypothetical protein [Oharaeibacter diazotrophicus]|uniref:Secreted protein n=1 Tax=Oharaeibacter diazotrophicus TaxID=1920512 RepID=A0A4R6RGX2_9HYPH|nr:hypothetical protein [Oharaeibacter diazotrophicus]TDP85580.1 hypothetical protein EDD54_2434 [Oharaeibacter diazotrophicus]BBE74551.1 hypothetical protein OHA_1_04182 [Pleomorphomonas sp. SM30]GLS75750.1 hypothetical protein GCM10007904_10850 [Oharaeibacter diazotrophicus]